MLTPKLAAAASVFTLVMMTAATVKAQDVKTSKTNPAPAVAVAKGVDKDGNVKYENNAYLTLSGTVGNIVDEDTFQLNHSGGMIEVEVDDTWEGVLATDNAASGLKTGDRVTVTGKVDNNMFSTNELEAYSMTVAGKDFSRVYSSDELMANTNDYDAYYNMPYGAGLEEDQKVRLSGEVSQIVDDKAFMLRYGQGEIRVDTDDLDFTNANALTIGDEVVVFGEVDKDWFQKKEVEADRVILSRAYSQIVR